jgi:hypothetical protein
MSESEIRGDPSRGRASHTSLASPFSIPVVASLFRVADAQTKDMAFYLRTFVQLLSGRMHRGVSCSGSSWTLRRRLMYDGARGHLRLDPARNPPAIASPEDRAIARPTELTAL